MITISVLRLQRVEKTIRVRIVAAVSPTAHATEYQVLLQLLLVFTARVLRPAVRMEYYRRRPASRYGLP